MTFITKIWTDFVFQYILFTSWLFYIIFLPISIIYHPNFYYWYLPIGIKSSKIQDGSFINAKLIKKFLFSFINAKIYTLKNLNLIPWGKIRKRFDPWEKVLEKFDPLGRVRERFDPWKILRKRFKRFNPIFDPWKIVRERFVLLRNSSLRDLIPWEIVTLKDLILSALYRSREDPELK